MMNDDTIVFTPAALVDVLSSIDELSDKSISINQAGTDVEITIGSSTYSIKPSEDITISVSEDLVDEVESANQDAYDEITEETELVEGGLIKQIAKTLLVGGMVRLTSKLLK